MRKRYYNPVLDPYIVANKMTPAMAQAVLDGEYDDGTQTGGGPLHEPDETHPANLISSLCEDAFHRPALDIDLGAMDAKTISCFMAGFFKVSLELVEVYRSTKNWHVLIDYPLSWDEYQTALNELVDLGWVEEGYLLASMNRGQTLLRVPNLTKEGWLTEID